MGNATRFALFVYIQFHSRYLLTLPDQGTSDFMSVEVDAMEYKFQPMPKGGTYTRFRKFASKFDTGFDDNPALVREDGSDAGSSDDDSSVVKPKENSEDTVQKWAYNPIHDLESLFWLFFFFVAWHDVFVVPKKTGTDEATTIAKPPENPSKSGNTFDISDSDSDPDSDLTVKLPTRYQESPEARADRIKAWYTFGEGLFIKRDSRLPVLSVPTRLENFVKEHPLHPAMKKMGDFLIACRNSLGSAYLEAEKDISSLSSGERRLKVAEGLHEDLFAILMLARQSVSRGDGWVVHIRRLGRQEWKLRQQEKAANGAVVAEVAGARRREESSSTGLEEVNAAISRPGEKKKRAVRPGPSERRVIPVKRAQKPPHVPVKSDTHAVTAIKRKRGVEEDGADAELRVHLAPRKVSRKRRNEGSVHDVVDDAEPKPIAVKRRAAKARQPPQPPPPTTRILRSRAKGSKYKVEDKASHLSTARSNLRNKDAFPADSMPAKPGGRTLRPRTRK